MTTETTMSTISPREYLLSTAEQLVMQDRNNQYGPPMQDFERIADLLNVLGFQWVDSKDEVHDIKPHQVAMIMIALKLSRITWDPYKFDSWADVAGYAACGWECAWGDLSE